MMDSVRVTRLMISRFRGWQTLDLRPVGHVLLAGVPRAGRSDIIVALARVLDPDAVRNAVLSDLHQELPRAKQEIATAQETGAPDPGQDDPGRGAASDSDADESGVPIIGHTEIEVTLADLDPDMQQLFDGHLEALGPDGAVADEGATDPSVPHCTRLAYRLSYDPVSEVMESVVYFPASSNPDIGQFVRVPAATRRALPVITLTAGRPLQLRAGGNLRRILDGRDPDAGAAAFDALRAAVVDAASNLSNHPAIAGAVDAVLAAGGAGTRLGDDQISASQVDFVTEDGSLPALLRTLQPALRLDSAGTLTLPSHGSTATAVLSAAEAMLLATVPGAVVLADDFGDQLDTAAAEHLAAVLRARCGQLWLSTRRAEAARAFEPGELVRLVRHGGKRAHHQLAKTTERKALSAMRQLHTQLLAAVTAPTVVITEGPHDLAVYAIVDRRHPPRALPLSAHGARLVAAGTGSDGGIDQIPRVANLAKQLGFRVLAVIDRDKDSHQSRDQLAKVQDACDVVIRLPHGAIERAMLTGVSTEMIRAASVTLTEYGITDPTAGRTDEAALTELCKVIHKQGLHEQYLDALYAETGGAHPPVIETALSSVAAAASAAYNGPALVDLQSPATTVASTP